MTAPRIARIAAEADITVSRGVARRENAAVPIKPTRRPLRVKTEVSMEPAKSTARLAALLSHVRELGVVLAALRLQETSRMLTLLAQFMPQALGAVPGAKTCFAEAFLADILVVDTLV